MGELFILIWVAYLITMFVLLLNKQSLHFDLLKSLYSSKLNKYNSFNSFYFTLGIFILSFKDFLWYSFPIYIKRNKMTLDEKQEVIDVTLRQNNKIMSIVTLIAFLILFWIGYFVL
jgi:hypothetical protein